MEENKKQYWKGLEQLTNDIEYVKHADKEFPEYLPVNGEEPGENSSRRDFLKLMGFGVAAAALASCEAPIRNAIPYVTKPVDIDPGVPNYYASSYFQGGDYCSVVVKTREGRPIKIEGNKLSSISQGGTNALVEASVLSLYDKERLTNPLNGEEQVGWDELDKAVVAGLQAAQNSGKKIALVSNTVISPSTLKIIEAFKIKYPATDHIQYDTQSASGIIKANDEAFGLPVVPSYHFDKAKVIVSFDADFLGTWISPIEFTKGYSKTRKLGPKKKQMSRHYQFESNLSLTGANADYRIPIKPSQEGAAVIALHNAIASQIGGSKLNGEQDFKYINKAAKDLLSVRGNALVVSGSNDVAIQTLVGSINDMLGNYGSAITFHDHLNTKKGDDSAMDQFIADTKAGNVGAAIFLNCNPVYNHARGAELASALPNVGFTVSAADRKDETAVAVQYNAPDSHYLESWNDAEPKKGIYSLTQPSISNLFDTRQQEQSLMVWAGITGTYFDYIKSNWQANFDGSVAGLGYQTFWDTVLQNGVYTVASEEHKDVQGAFDVTTSAASIGKNYKGSGFELTLYQKVSIGDGTQANNPWLHETPDVITKATWDNYLTVAIADASELGITEAEGKANMANLTVNGTTVKLPVVIQPGQARGTLGLAVGYGRTNAGKVANNLGVNANPFIGMLNGSTYNKVMAGINLEVLSELYHVARTQTHHTYMGRENVVQESILASYQKNPSAGRYHPHVATWQSPDGFVAPGTLSLWKGHKYKDHHWGMAIDMNSCTGCSACHVACVAENNIAVVGRQEVINRRDMHWMRIDRYYSSDSAAVGAADGIIGELSALEQAAENPEVIFQPMMCQHCNNAGCETVCPVAATTHSTSGLNQMAYNRCIGTRYCANNCAYKVRRFNWFKYHDNKQFGDNLSQNNDLGKMVLNPDVTVRSRGVMEKCSMCVQRIQLGKLEAKKEGRRTNDGDINMACASSCPADAITFGDMNDPNSALSKLLRIKDQEGDYGIDKQIGEERAYTVLEEVGTKPNVLYLTKIRNKDKEDNNA